MISLFSKQLDFLKVYVSVVIVSVEKFKQKENVIVKGKKKSCLFWDRNQMKINVYSRVWIFNAKKSKLLDNYFKS